MQIVGISLKDYGASGMKVTYNKYLRFTATHATKINGNEESDLPLPANIRAEIKGLKYYMLYIMKMWNDDWDKYLTEDLAAFLPESELKAVDGYDESEYLEAADIFNNTRFEGYKLEKGGFILWGDIEVIHGKVVKIKLPTIVQDDDFTLFNDCLDIIEKINEMIVAYYSKPQLSIEDIKETLALIGGEQMKDEIKDLDDEESYNQMIAKLESKGGLVIIEEGSDLEKEIEKDTAEIVSTKTLKDGKIDEHEEVSTETKENQELETESKDDDWPENHVVHEEQQQKIEDVKEADQNPESSDNDIEDF